MEESDLENVPVGETVSALLVSAREELGLSQKDVADMLFLQVTCIQRIDEGLFHDFPKPVYIKGYLRSYSRVLGLDGDHIVKLYGAQAGSKYSSDKSIKIEERVEDSFISASFFKTGILGLVIILFAVVLVWKTSSKNKEVEFVDAENDSNFGFQEERSRNDITKNIASEIDLADVALSVDSSDDGIPAQINRRFDDSMDELIEKTELQKHTAPSIEEIKGISVQRSMEGSKEYITVKAGGEDHIEFSFLADCWVEVEDGEGYSIYGDLNGEKDVLNIFGIAPFKILLGDAAVVKMIYNGEEVDLREYIENDEIAEVILGQI